MSNDILVPEDTGNRRMIFSDDKKTKISPGNLEFNALDVDMEKVAQMDIPTANKAIVDENRDLPTPAPRNTIFDQLVQENLLPYRGSSPFKKDQPLMVDGISISKITMGVMVMGSDQHLLKKVEEQEAIIRNLTTKLSEFERVHSFMPSELNLPDDYFEDLVE